MLIKILNLIELSLARLQGKGWGSGTVKKEFASASSLFNKSPHLCVDIGGNKGLYTKEILSKFPACKVVIFEPSINNSNFLHNNGFFVGNASKDLSIQLKKLSQVLHKTL